MKISRYQFLKNKYLENQSLITEEEFNEIIFADPTTIEKDDEIKVGQYSQWLFRIFEKLIPSEVEYQERKEIDVFLEDLYKVKNDLNYYNIAKIKNKLPTDKRDINSITTLKELYFIVKEFYKQDILLTKKQYKSNVKRTSVSVLYDGFEWDIVSPKTRDAAIAISGAPLTRWCTGSEGIRNQFDSYNNRGPLYIIRNKRTIVPSGRGAGEPKPLFQFHFESQTFMDEDDITINIVDLLKREEELKWFFKTYFEKQIQSSKVIKIHENSGANYKFIQIYGFNEFINLIHDDVIDIDIVMTNSNFSIPSSFSRFQKLKSLYVEGNLTSIPDEISLLKSLEFLTFKKCRFLQSIPKSIAKLPNLISLNLAGSNIKKIPDELIELDAEEKIWLMI